MSELADILVSCSGNNFISFQVSRWELKFQILFYKLVREQILIKSVDE